MNKKIIIPIIAIGVVFAGFFSVSSVFARFGQNNNIAQELAGKLGIDESKVATAMDEIKQQNQDEKKAKISENLDKAVTDGVISAEQKQAIVDKQAENQKQREQKRTEIQQWAKDNGIDFSKLNQYGVGHNGKSGMTRNRSGSADQ